ncbi:MAG: hypothetical protein KGQ41_09880, partial [Alphaproteobacteria bacterium]|nr:hypothetical protein [Alphaproteobacteria bacterium]
MPTRSGGLREIMEPRFGSLFLGHGWWDSPGTAELRIAPMRSPRYFINTYHHMIKTVYEAAENFRLIPEMHRGSPQLHFSLWEDQELEGKFTNTMAMQYDMDVVSNEYLMYGLYGMIGEAPHLINDYDPTNPNYSFDLDIGHTKGHSIRQNGRSWEWRRNQKSNFIHLARDLALIIGGAYHTTMAPSMLNIPTLREKYPGVLSERYVLHVEDKHKRNYFNPFLHFVAECHLTNNNSLLMTVEGITRYQEDLIEALGGVAKAATYKFKHPKDGTEFGLDTIMGVALLMLQITVNPDETLNTDNIHDDLKPHFERIRVKGMRATLAGPSQETLYGPSHLLATVDQLAESKALKSFFYDDEIEKIQDFYRNRIPERLYHQAEILLDAACAIPDTSDKNPEKPKLAALFKQTVMAALREEQVARMVPEFFCHVKKPETIAELRTKPNTVMLLREQFRAAVETRIANLRKAGNLNNHAAAVMHDALDFLDNEALDLRTYHAADMAEGVHSLAASMNAFKKEKFGKNLERSFVISKLEGMAMMALTDPRYTKADVLRMLEGCKQQAVDHLKTLEQGPDPSIRAMVKKLRAPQVTKAMHAHNRRSRKVMKRL